MNIANEWNNLSVLIPKDKYEKIKVLAHQIIEEVKTNTISTNDIDLYINILNQASRVSGFPQKYSRTLSLLILKKLSLTGDDKAEIICKKSGHVSIESGTVSVGDPALESSIILKDYLDKNLLEITNQGKRLFFSTGGDGLFDVQLRIIKATEPVLTPKEYKLVLGSTQTVILEISSGVISVGDLGLLDKSELKVTVPTGNYKVCTYVFDTHKNFRSYYVVCTPTQLPAMNTSTTITVLE
jgi:hypothetical protein